MGRNVFVLNDYQSLIGGGHNFSVVSTSLDEISSQYMHPDLEILFDERGYEQHREELSEGGLLIYNSDNTKGVGCGLPMTTEAQKRPKPDLPRA